MAQNDLQQLVVTHHVTINAPASRVWQVLTEPSFIDQWDDVPDDVGDRPLRPGSVMEWEGISRLTVTAFEPERRLRLKLHVAKWENPPEAYDIGYEYALAERDGHTELSLLIGDFAALPDGDTYHDASEEFAEEALPKIKELAEKMDPAKH